MQTTLTNTLNNELAKKRREILARCYQIILSSDWGVTDSSLSAHNKVDGTHITFQATAEKEAEQIHHELKDRNS